LRQFGKKFAESGFKGETSSVSAPRIGAIGETAQHIVMTPSIRSACSWVCIACAMLLSLCLIGLGPREAHAQDAPEDSVSASEQGAEAEGTAKEPSGAWDISRPCDNVQHPYQAEVCQQMRVADASESTARLSRLIMLIGLAGVALLLLMLWPIIAAALAARRAASNSSAREGHARSPNSADREAELRAYVDVESLEFADTPEADGVVKVKIAFRNSGQTPAFKFEDSVEMEVVDIDDDEPLPTRSISDNASATSSRARLGRDATAIAIVQCESTPKLADRVTNGEAMILVWGEVGYDDIFDRRHQTVFQFVCNAETLETGEMFRPMARETTAD
jgi:hypothetical protein